MNVSYDNISRKLKEIPLTVVGIDFRLAPSALRQELVTSSEERVALFKEIKKIDGQAEFMALETCNRIEWIVATVEPAWLSEILKARMMVTWRKSRAGKLKFPTPFTYIGIDALEHIFNVVVGKESLATGEAQIAGQFHESSNKARKEQSTGPILKRLAVAGGRLTKAGSRTGFRSNQKMGIHGLVSHFFQQHLPEFQKKNVLVVGMGSIGRKTAQLLEADGRYKVDCFNRTIDDHHRGKWHPIQSLSEYTEQADGLVIATGASAPVLDDVFIPKRNPANPLVVLDIGIPLQVSDELQKSTKIGYHNIDDLMELPDRQEKEPEGLEELNAEIAKEIELFERFCRERNQQMTRVLSSLHQGRQQFIRQHIPEMVQERLSNLEELDQKRVQTLMKDLLNAYAQDIHSSLIEAINAFGGFKNGN